LHCIFSRRAGAVIAVDPVGAMREAAARNLQIAAKDNPWSTPVCRDSRRRCFALPVPDTSVDVVAQNCLFNIFEPTDLPERFRKHFGFKTGWTLADERSIATRPIPAHLQQDERLRAMCLSGALTYEQYIQRIVDAGFGQVEIRARRPYRLLDRYTYNLEDHLP